MSATPNCVVIPESNDKMVAHLNEFGFLSMGLETLTSVGQSCAIAFGLDPGYDADDELEKGSLFGFWVDRATLGEIIDVLKAVYDNFPEI